MTGIPPEANPPVDRLNQERTVRGVSSTEGERWRTPFVLLAGIGLVLSLGGYWNGLVPSIFLASFPAYRLGESFPRGGGPLVFAIGICLLAPWFPVIDTCFAAALLGWCTAFSGLAQMKLSRALRTDSLTGLLNRKGLEDELTSRLRTRGGPGTDQKVLVICLDCDQFKSFNDRWGHRAGDELLICAAESLRKSAPNGLVGRLGGDEFAVVSICQTLDDAHEIARKIHEYLCRVGTFKEQPRFQSLTWTLGVAGFSSPASVNARPDCLDDLPVASPKGSDPVTQRRCPQQDWNWNVTAMMDRADELMLLGKKERGGAIIIEIDGVRLPVSSHGNTGHGNTGEPC